MEGLIFREAFEVCLLIISVHLSIANACYSTSFLRAFPLLIGRERKSSENEVACYLHSKPSFPISLPSEDLR